MPEKQRAALALSEAKKALQGKRAIARLNSLSPLTIISRGYSITTYKLPPHSLVKSSANVQRGDKVDIQLHDGNIACVVDDVISG